LLHDRLGFQDIHVNEKAIDAGLKFDEGIEMVRRLSATAKQHSLGFGAKFSNTLEVINHRQFFPKDQIMYLSGAPLHVITLHLVERWRQSYGPDCPISFSAGVDKHNFANCVACGFVPITTCSDLLKVGGFGRLFEYLKNLEQEMNKLGVANLDDFILKREGNEPAAFSQAKGRRDAAVNQAGVLNLGPICRRTIADERYSFGKNKAVPKRIDSHLWLYDCISCDKCIPVCPNDANFYYEVEPVEIEFTNYTWDGEGLQPADHDVLKIEQKHQIANFVDWCNECGNCDTFCPEYGGPFIQKPGFFTNRAMWLDNAKRDGFYVTTHDGLEEIVGRMAGQMVSLTLDSEHHSARYNDGVLEVSFDTRTHSIVNVNPLETGVVNHRLNVRNYHTLRILLGGMLNPSRVHQVNVAHL
jgi:putative selenate reductase